MDKELIASEREVSLGHFQLLYSTPEAILGANTLWRQLLVSPPLSENVVAVAIDEAHCLQIVSDLKYMIITNQCVQYTGAKIFALHLVN